MNKATDEANSVRIQPFSLLVNCAKYVHDSL
uniref:Uncharacterized protein n=1 Tax=Heterorhabditis bacteriophora TaxID=37862 RepID=A0A1I7XJI5_HETBA